MKRRLTLFITVVLPLIAPHRLPAPIVEEGKQTPAPTESAQPKSKPATSQKAEASSDSSAPRRFDGTWRQTRTERYVEGSIQLPGTMVINNGKKAQLTIEATFTLAPGKSWPGSFLLPPPYDKVSPISAKLIDESTDLKVEGPNLIILWPPMRLADWAPKTIPSQAFEKLKGSEKAVTYIQDGARLIATDGKHSFIWQRVQ